MEITLNFADVIAPVVGAWEPTGRLTAEVECSNEWWNAVTGDGPYPCGNRVWIDPEWLTAHERLWPVHRPPVLCLICAGEDGDG